MKSLTLALSFVASRLPRLASGLSAYLFARVPGAIAGSLNGPELVRVVVATLGTSGANASLVAVLLAIKGDPAVFTSSAATAIGTALITGLIFGVQRFQHHDPVAFVEWASAFQSGLLSQEECRFVSSMQPTPQEPAKPTAYPEFDLRRLEPLPRKAELAALPGVLIAMESVDESRMVGRLSHETRQVLREALGGCYSSQIPARLAMMTCDEEVKVRSRLIEPPNRPCGQYCPTPERCQPDKPAAGPVA